MSKSSDLQGQEDEERPLLARLWDKHVPPRDIEKVLDDIHRSVCDSMLHVNQMERKVVRRGAASIASKLEDSALLVAAVKPKAWGRVRKLKIDKVPKDHGLRCQWLLAAAWRAARWLDKEPLTEAELKAVRSLVTDGKAAASSIPSGFRIDAEEVLRNDEEERSKVPGPELVEGDASDSVYVERAYDPNKAH